MNDNLLASLLSGSESVRKHLAKRPCGVLWIGDPVSEGHFDRWWAEWNIIGTTWCDEVVKYSSFAKKLREQDDGKSAPVDTVECILAYLDQDGRYQCRNEDEEFVFANFMNETVTLMRKDGTTEAVKACVQKDRIYPDFDLDVVYEEGDKIVRAINEHHKEVYTITRATHTKAPRTSSIPSHWTLDVKKDTGKDDLDSAVYTAHNMVVNNGTNTGDVNNGTSPEHPSAIKRNCLVALGLAIGAGCVAVFWNWVANYTQNGVNPIFDAATSWFKSLY